jgi:hypothetical protein
MSHIINDIYIELLYRKPNKTELNIFNFCLKKKLLKKKYIKQYIKSTDEYIKLNKDNNILNNIYNYYLNRNIDQETLLIYNNYINNSEKNIKDFVDEIFISKEYCLKKTNLLLWNNFIDNIKIEEIIEVKKNSIYNCIIIEPRNHIHLKKIIYQFAKILGHKFQLQIFHGLNNIKLIEDIKNIIINVKCFNLNIDNLSINDYSKIIKSENFWNIVEGEHILIFQTDTFIFKNLPRSFFNFDYIGAPWNNLNNISNTYIGNGGLSLRKKSSMLNIIKKYKHNKDYNTLPEDVFFVKYLKINKNVLPSVIISKEFCVENMYYRSPYCLHKPYLELKTYQLSKLLDL